MKIEYGATRRGAQVRPRRRPHPSIFVLLLLVLPGWVLPVSVRSGGQVYSAPDRPGEERRIYRLFLEIEDGDTVVYRGRRLRFLGVDAPEVSSPEHGIHRDQPYGREAAMFTRREIKKAGVVTYVADGTDRYGRLLAHLFVDGYPLSVKIVEAGLGYETVSVYGDNGFPEIAVMILRAAKLHPELPFQKPYLWRRRHRQ